MGWIGLLFIAYTLVAFAGNSNRGIKTWSFFTGFFDHYAFVLFPGVPTVTYNFYTIIPFFIIHFFSGKLARNFSRIPKTVLVPIILFSAVSLIELFRTDMLLSQAVQYYLHRDVFPYLIFIMILTLDWTRQELDGTFKAIFLGLVIAAGFAVFENITHIPVFISFDDYALEFFPYRPNGPFQTIAGLNTVLSMGFLLLLPQIRRWNGAWRFFGRLGLLLILVANVMAFYRGTLIPLFGLLFLWMWREPRRRTVSVIALLLVAIVGIASSGAFKETRLYEERLSVPFSSRVATYMQAGKAIANQPLVGYGYGNAVSAMESLSPSYYKGAVNRVTPHNAYLQMLLEAGVIGLGAMALWFIALGGVLRQAYREAGPEHKDERLAGYFILVQYLLLNLTLTSYSGTANIALLSFVGLSFAQHLASRA